MRIVSLLSSATEIVYELGLEGSLVAISHECDHPPEALRLPRASRSRFHPEGLTSGEVDAAVRRAIEEHGSVYEVNVAVLRKVAPDLVLTQAVCEVCAVPTGSVLTAVQELDAEPRVVSLDAHTLAGILESIQQVADAAGASERGEAVVSRLAARLEAVRARVAGRTRPRVLMLEWLDPPFAPGHWVPEMVDVAGGDLLVGNAAERSSEIAWEALEGCDPDVLLIEPCGYDLELAAADAERNRHRLYRVAPRAVQEGRAWLLHSSYFSRSGPRLVDGVEALARILHPAHEPAPLGNRARPWR